jgi:hypothetical protein
MSDDLTIEDLTQKIAKVKEDIEALRSVGDASRRLEVLSEYKDYLEDELKFLKNEKRNSQT